MDSWWSNMIIVCVLSALKNNSPSCFVVGLLRWYRMDPCWKAIQKSSSLSRGNRWLHTLLRWIRFVPHMLHVCWLHEQLWLPQMDFCLCILAKWRFSLLEKVKTRYDCTVDDRGWIHSRRDGRSRDSFVDKLA